MKFDDNGFLLPYQGNVASLEEVAQQFTWNKRRLNIWEKYILYMEELNALLKYNFIQYLNGSFISKKNIPIDLDFVSFIDNRDYTNTNKEKFKLITKKYIKRLDSYYAVSLPINDKDYLWKTDYFLKMWEYDFSHKNLKDKLGNTKTINKGFIILKYEK